MALKSVSINRAPVLTLWATVVAEHLGFEEDTALTLGKAVAGLNAQAKGRSLGIFRPPNLAPGKRAKKHGQGDEFWIDLCGRAIPAKQTDHGVRAVVKDEPIDPSIVRAYLEKSFGETLESVRVAMSQLAGGREPFELADEAFGLYERFRPQIAPGRRGWGQKGKLDLRKIRSMVERK